MFGIDDIIGGALNLGGQIFGEVAGAKKRRQAADAWKFCLSTSVARLVVCSLAAAVPGARTPESLRPHAEIAFYTSLLYLPWAVKPLWSPVVDLLKTRRAWIWSMQLLIAFALGGVALTGEGLLAGATQVYRLCLLVTVAALLTFTASSTQLAHGLEALLGPLQRVGLPVSELIMVLTIALRFVPTFFEEIEKIGRAQRARGADFQSGSPAQRIRGLVPLFILEQFIGPFAMIVPHYWANKALDDLFIRGLGLADIYISLIMLAVFSLIFFLIGLWRFDFEQ
jgi:hypothetical protein